MMSATSLKARWPTAIPTFHNNSYHDETSLPEWICRSSLPSKPLHLYWKLTLHFENYKSTTAFKITNPPPHQTFKNCKLAHKLSVNGNRSQNFQKLEINLNILEIISRLQLLWFIPAWYLSFPVSYLFCFTF